MWVDENAEIEVNDAASPYVSRAALKLVSALDVCGINPHGQVCLDIGASTGGFTQVLLERGAARVYAVDVGHDQLVEPLREDPRVVVLEGTNVRELTADDLAGPPPALVVCDVSFISLRLALPPALALTASPAQGIFLIKPQFEVGRAHLGKGGVVKDPEQAEAGARAVADWFATLAEWQVTHFLPSPIHGADGNREYLMTGIKHG